MPATVDVAPHLSLISHNQNLLNRNEIKEVKLDIKDPYYFTYRYQDEAATKPQPMYYTLRTLLNAVYRSEEQFQQFPVVNNNLRTLAKAVFVTDEQMLVDPTIALIDNQYYIVGGRHRVTAIARVFAQYIRHTYKDKHHTEEELQHRFARLLDMRVRCDILHVKDAKQLMKLIIAHNGDRTMRVVEVKHIEAQQEGADAATVESISDVVLRCRIPSRAAGYAGQNFSRRPHERLKDQTKQELGERVAKYILFGADPNKMLDDSINYPRKVATVDEFEAQMDRAWDILQDLIKDEVRIAINRASIAKEITTQLQEPKQ